MQKNLKRSSPFRVAGSRVRLFLCLAAGAVAAHGARPAYEAPDPREIPVPEIKTSFPRFPTVDELPVRKEMPPVLAFENGMAVKTQAQWQLRREEMKRILAHYATGHFPPPPGNVRGRVIQSETVSAGTVRYRLVHLTFGPAEELSLNVGIFTPVGREPAPCVIFPGGTPPGAPRLPMQKRPSGQGRGANALMAPASPPRDAPLSPRSNSPLAQRDGSLTAVEIATRNAVVFERGYGIVMFNPQDCAEDTTLRNEDGSWAFRNTRFFPAYPGYDWGILAGWAWGVWRIVDYLQTDPLVDQARLIVSGGSRTGKSAVIAAAFDERIAMAAPAVTGAGGTPAYRYSGPGRGDNEGIGVQMHKYPNWFSPHLRQFWGHVDKLPFDQHWFLALVAPRPFLSLDALADNASSRHGVKHSLEHARPAYKLLNAADRLGVHFANHGHTFNDEDWGAMLDFADKHLLGKPVERRFDYIPAWNGAAR